MVRILGVVGLLVVGGCEQKSPVTGSASGSASAFASASASAFASASPSVSASASAPAGPIVGLDREESWDDECEKGRKAYSGSGPPKATRERCDGPALVNYTTRDPKTGDTADGEIPIWCCR